MTHNWFITIVGADYEDRSLAEQEISGALQSLPADIPHTLSQKMQVQFRGKTEAILSGLAPEQDAKQLLAALRLRLRSVQFKGTIAWRATPLVCPHCGRQVKAGASTCHHCGRVVVPQDTYG